MDFAQRRKRFAEYLKRDSIIVAPGAYDAIGARLIEHSGFEVVYLTGAGVSMSSVGAPDIGVVYPTELISRVYTVAQAVNIPLLVDGETGFGGPLNVKRFVRDLENAGATAVQLEDQEYPKKCGHDAGKHVTEPEEMVKKIEAAVEARSDRNLAIIARTDAAQLYGIDNAIERAKMYVKAGADVIFIEAPESEEEMEKIAREVPAPTLINIVEGGVTPLVSNDRLEEMGHKIVIYPNALTRAFVKNGLALLKHLREHKSTVGFMENMVDKTGLHGLFKMDPFWFEQD